MFLLLLLLYMVSASIIRDIESDTSPVTNVPSCCNLCPSYKTQAKFQKRKMAGKLKKNKKKENQKKKMKENKFALLWGEAQLCLPYVCLQKKIAYSYPKVSYSFPKVTLR